MNNESIVEDFIENEFTESFEYTDEYEDEAESYEYSEIGEESETSKSNL